MLFNSYTFLLGFFPAFVVAFYALRRQGPRLGLVVAASYVFYGWARWWFPFLMLGATAIAYLGGRALESAGGGQPS